MTEELPKFENEAEESEFWDNPKNVADYFADAEEVEVDLGPLREKIHKKRVREAAKLRKRTAAG